MESVILVLNLVSHITLFTFFTTYPIPEATNGNTQFYPYIKLFMMHSFSAFQTISVKTLRILLVSYQLQYYALFTYKNRRISHDSNHNQISYLVIYYHIAINVNSTKMYCLIFGNQVYP